VLSKDELLQQIWPDAFVEEVNLAVNVSTLRRVLGENPQDRRFIATVSGRGYRFVAPVTCSQQPEVPAAGGANPSGERPEFSNREVQATLPEAGREAPARLRFLPGLLIVLLLAGLGAYFFEKRKGNQQAAMASESSVAVLPFTDLSADKDQEYFSDG